jgi:DNA-3-methyladenine glycosylase
MLPYAFYARPARVVAQDLLGKRLVRVLNNGLEIAGIIIETEAYCDSPEPDLACHASKNNGQPTPRTITMFGKAGHAFVYFTYGNHWMFNIVTGETGQANGVLIRALEPTHGEPTIAQNRHPQPRTQWTNGPGKLAQALAINKNHNGSNLCDPNGVIWLEDAWEINANQIATGPRVGMGKTPEPWFSMPWRYWLKDNQFVSKYR